MDFKSRFKGKMTVMNKEGVIGIVSKPSMPIIKNNQYYANEASPTIKKTFHQNDNITESKSHIFTHIQLQQGKKQNNLQNAGSEVLRQSKMKTEMNHYDEQKQSNRFSLRLHQHMNQVDMDEYEIVAIPRNMLGQLRQQISVDRYALTHSFAPEREQTFKQAQMISRFKQGSPGLNSHQATPLHKQNTIDQLKPPLFKQQSERFEKKNKTIQQAGLGTLRNKQVQYAIVVPIVKDDLILRLKFCHNSQIKLKIALQNQQGIKQYVGIIQNVQVCPIDDPRVQ